MTRREEIARALRTYQQADPEAVIVEVSRQVCDEAAAILSLPAQEPGELVTRLRIKSSMIAMGEKIAFGSDSALMDKAASALTDQAAEIERLRVVNTERGDRTRKWITRGMGYLRDRREFRVRAEKAEAERDDYKRKLDDAVAALEFYANPYGRDEPVPDFYSELDFGDRAHETVIRLTEGK